LGSFLSSLCPANKVAKCDTGEWGKKRIYHQGGGLKHPLIYFMLMRTATVFKRNKMNVLNTGLAPAEAADDRRFGFAAPPSASPLLCISGGKYYMHKKSRQKFQPGFFVKMVLKIIPTKWYRQTTHQSQMTA
jgi:hypothetical protein